MRSKSTSRTFIQWLGVAVLLSFSSWVQATVTCSASATGFTAGYQPTGTSINITPATLTVSCTDSATGPSPQSITYSVTVNNGANPSGTQNRATSGANTINYSLASDAACATAWSGAATITGTISIALNQTIVNTYPFYGCIPALQNPPAGTYLDTVTMTGTATKNGGGANPVFINPSTFPVNVITPAVCTLTTPPGNINFAYTSFSPTAANASTTYSLTCTTTLPYTMALDATSGTLLGLNYTLALSAASGTGTGLLQSYTISGSMIAGQVGTCAGASCLGTQARTLTITY